jgi:hypothetical protein
MKTKPHPAVIQRFLCLLPFLALALSTPLHAATNTPAAELMRTGSSVLSGVTVYSIRFPGGKMSDFFTFLRTNGFSNDTILFAGESRRVHLPAFTVSNLQLKEVAKSIEFVAEGRITVELVEAHEAGNNIWRIKPAGLTLPGALKTRSCAVPHLLSRQTGEKGVRELLDLISDRLFATSASLSGGQSPGSDGIFSVLTEEKIVVAMGTEAYVEAITSALEAAEKVAAYAAAGKTQTQ